AESQLTRDAGLLGAGFRDGARQHLGGVVTRRRQRIAQLAVPGEQLAHGLRGSVHLRPPLGPLVQRALALLLLGRGLFELHGRETNRSAAPWLAVYGLPRVGMPPLLSSRSMGTQFLLANVVPCVAGAVCG